MTTLENEFVNLAQSHFKALNKVYYLLMDYSDKFHRDREGNPINTPESVEFSKLLDDMHNLQATYGNKNEQVFCENNLRSFYDLVDVDEGEVEC